MTTKLRIGDRVPQVTFDLVGGECLTIPDDFSTDFGLVLLYRGHW
jgi:hypothetical protein